MASANITRCNLVGIEFSEARPVKKSCGTLICLHGIGGDDSSFNPQLTSLSEHYRVISWNMPGYKSSGALHHYSFANLADKLAEFIAALGEQQVHLMGQSIGGMLVQEMNVRHARLVQSMVLVATTSAFGGKDDSFKEAFIAARLKPLLNGISMREQAKMAIPTIVGPEISSIAKNEAIDAMAGLNPEVYKAVLECLVSFDRRDALANIKQPVCLIAGALDSNAPAKTMAKMAQRLSFAQMHELENAGHLVNIERPDSVNAITLTFLNKQLAHE